MRLSPWLMVLSVLLWASSTRTGYAGNNIWTSLGPAGGDVHSLVIDPSTSTTLYVGTGCGVLTSTGGGSSWFAVKTGLRTNPFVTALALDPSTPTTLYAEAGDSGVFKSTDGGNSWFAVNTGLPTTFV